ncbi:MAG: phosphoribosylformylglycinamidine synthase subunit PurS [Pseudomonadota bacterium]
MKFAVKVLPKPEVLDTQGRAVQHTLQSHGFQVERCQVGKYIVLQVPSSNPEEGETQARSMVEKGLYNPLIENYELEQL